MMTHRTHVDVYDLDGAPLGTASVILSRTTGDGWGGMLQKRPEDSMQSIPLEGNEIVLQLPNGRQARVVIISRAPEPEMTINIAGVGPVPFD